MYPASGRSKRRLRQARLHGRDRKDDCLVALARAVGADVIVSGDRHLTELPDPDPPLLNPRDFVARLQLS